MVAQIDKDFYKLSKRKTLIRLACYLFEGRPVTTKGRWFNPFVFLVYHLLNVLPNNGGVKSPIFVVGTGRSGTTILGVTLGMHRDVAFLNEPKALWSHLVSGEDLIGSYDSAAANYYINPDEIEESVVGKANRILGNFLRVLRTERVVDKYPELIFRIEVVKKLYPDSKFIFLYRNGWDTCQSIKRWSERLGVLDNGQKHDWWGVDNRKWKALQQVVKNDPDLSVYQSEIAQYTDHVAMAAVEWILTMRAGMSAVESHPDDFFALKYEDYISDEGLRGELLGFCGLPPDSNYEAYCRSTLKPPASVDKMRLPKEIEGAFLGTMEKLGYE